MHESYVYVFSQCALELIFFSLSVTAFDSSPFRWRGIHKVFSYFGISYPFRWIKGGEGENKWINWGSIFSVWSKWVRFEFDDKIEESIISILRIGFHMVVRSIVPSIRQSLKISHEMHAKNFPFIKFKTNDRILDWIWRVKLNS